MANDNDLSALARRMDAIADMLNGDMTTAGHAVGKGGRTVAKSVAAEVTGGDGVLSHMGRKGARLGFRYDVEQQGRHVVMKLAPAGPWSLVESGAKPHTIPRATARRRRGGARFLMAPSWSHPVRAPVEHPGTKGSQSRKAITRTFARIRERASRDYHEAYLDKLAAVMR